MLSKEYLQSRVYSAVTESERTQAEQNMLLYFILEKLELLTPSKEVENIKEVVNIEQTTTDDKVIKTTKGRK